MTTFGAQYQSVRGVIAIFLLVLTSTLAAHAAAGDIVLYASKAVRKGSWTLVSDSSAAGGSAVRNADSGAMVASPSLSPANYFELTFPAKGMVPYRLWIRGKAAGNSIKSDSVWVQFSDSVSSTGLPLNRIGSSQGVSVSLQSCSTSAIHNWGWTDNGWCGLGSRIFFQSTGAHTLRVQVREDGFTIDQIVLSPVTYLTSTPGKLTDDATILAARVPVLTSNVQVSVSTNPSSGSTPLNVNFTPNAKLSGSSLASYRWVFGDGQTSTQALPSHVYQSTGTFTTTLVVTDNMGNKASNLTKITVNNPVSKPGTLTDTFSTGSLDHSKWLASNEPAPGSISGVNYGSFVPGNVDLSKGMLCLKLQQQHGSSGVVSVGGQIQSAVPYGFGTYEWIMRTSSTSSTPNGSGSRVSGQVSSGFTFINNSQTEIDYEIEGGHPDTVWMTNWTTVNAKQYTSATLTAPDAKFHSYKFVWSPGKIDFYLDGAFVSTHTVNIPSSPAYILVNHWGTNNTKWGGLATTGVERYLYISRFTYTPL
jgi:endo-1,3-1,4-beta-glycanase ExoK